MHTLTHCTRKHLVFVLIIAEAFDGATFVHDDLGSEPVAEHVEPFFGLWSHLSLVHYQHIHIAIKSNFAVDLNLQVSAVRDKC